MNPEMSLERITALLNVPKEMYDEYSSIIINAESICNTLFYDEVRSVLKIADEFDSYMDQFSKMLRAQLSDLAQKNVVLVYSSKKSSTAKYIDSWNEFQNRGKEDVNVMRAYNYLIDIFTNLADKLPNISVIDTEMLDPSFVLYHIGKSKQRSGLVLSRDLLDLLCLEYNDGMFDGITHFTRENLLKNNGTKKIPPMSILALPYYMCIRGYDKHGYNGIPRYGEKKSIKYVEDNVSTIFKYPAEAELMKIVGDARFAFLYDERIQVLSDAEKVVLDNILEGL